MGQLDRASPREGEDPHRGGRSVGPRRTHITQEHRRESSKEFPRPQRTLVLSLAALMWTVSPSVSVPVSTKQLFVGSRHICALTISVPA